MRPVLLGCGFALLALAAVAVARGVALESRQIRAEPPDRPVSVDVAALAGRLGAGMRLRTVSHQDPAQFPGAEFEHFEALLERSYPRVHAALSRERVNRHSLLYTWPGRAAALDPALLMAHHDVVPVEEGTEERWTHPPFSGAVADGFVWGRGAMDDKAPLFCVLEAVELLLAAGFAPERTLYLAFGHDEELGGDEGAVAIAALLASRGVKLAWVVDEGGVVARAVIPGIAAPVAVIGIAEKGSVGIQLSVEVEGGHSSTPPAQTAIGILAAALAKLETHPMPASLTGPTQTFLAYLAPELPLAPRVALANLWLFRPLVEGAFSRSPATNAMIRTSTAVTIFEGGVKENVLPARARAVVNFRILPGDTYEDVALHVRRTIDDERIELQVGVRSLPRNPSPVSRVDGEAFAMLQYTIAQVFPDAWVVPYLVIGGTDARHYTELSESVYRFGPFLYDRSDLARAHGTNERISLENLERAVRFYAELIRNGAG